MATQSQPIQRKQRNYRNKTRLNSNQRPNIPENEKNEQNVRLTFPKEYQIAASTAPY
jgi:hypothetical protein